MTANIPPDHFRADDGELLRVSAAELVRSFGIWRDRARTGPVHISNHGRLTHVLLDRAQFEALVAEPRASASRPPFDASLIDWLETPVIICDPGLVIRHVNRVAAAVCGKDSSAMAGLPLEAALPAVRGSLFELLARRCDTGHEAHVTDLSSPFTSGAWLHLQVFPHAGRTVLFFRDITEDVQTHRLADVKAALVDAIAHSGNVHYARISVRGTIDRVDESFCRMLGLTEDRLIGASPPDLATADTRVGFRAAIDRALREGLTQNFDVRLMTNHGTIVANRATLVQLHGAFGCEGAVMLLSECSQG